jgi:carbon monoxide dehydrogenase subunit G
MTSFETSVRIERPIEEVFAFVSDPLQFPQWNSAVQSVRETGGRTYSMDRELPSGRVRNDLEIVTREPPTGFGIRTTSGPTPFTYRYGFSSEGGETVVHLDATVDLDGPARLLGPLAARAIKHGVDDNFAALKRLCERPTGAPAARPG